MSTQTTNKHPFLDDLADDAALYSTILRKPVVGVSAIRRMVEMVGTFYRNPTPTFFGAVEDRHLMQYTATLTNGRTINAVGVIERNAMDKVHRVTMTFWPIDAAISLSAALGMALTGGEDRDLYL